MKLAIIGSSPLALEAALRFHLHGAALTWFNIDEREYENFFQNSLAADSYTTETGLNFLAQASKSYRPGANFDFSYWKQNYFLPLAEILKVEQKIRPHQVVSITKRFLAPQELPEKKSRFHDLFRLVFQVDPQEFIREQEASNPETFERLSQELIESLQTNLEMCEDFDLVLDLRRKTEVSSLSVTGRALGEGRVSKEQLFYSFDALDEARKIHQDPQDLRELALIGSEGLAAEIVITLSDWLKDQRSRLFIVSDESWPFAYFAEKGEESSVKSLKSIFDYMEQEFEADISTFHKKLREWQELDDFVQAKMPRPVEPIPRLVFFSGHNATAVDQLIDKRRLFLTLEKPDFRQGHRQPENNHLDLKTIGVDRILVANKLQRPKMEVVLDSQEKGFFTPELSLPNMIDAWSKDLQAFKDIENEIFKLFSPADAH